MLHKLFSYCFILFYFISVISCQSKSEIQITSSQENELLSELIAYNQSLEPVPETKSWGNIKAVARVDAEVAGEAFCEGFVVGAVAGVSSGVVGVFPVAITSGSFYGLFKGVSASREKHNECSGYSVIPNNLLFQRTLEAIVADRATQVMTSSGEALLDYGTNPIVDGSILLPEGYSVCEEVARSHNSVLSRMMSGETSISYNYEDYLTDSEISIIESQDFYDYFCSGNTLVHLSEDTLAGQIVALFFEAFEDAVGDIDDLDDLVNNYISSLENAGSFLSDQDHYSLYTTFVVLSFSMRYWESYYSNTY